MPEPATISGAIAAAAAEIVAVIEKILELTSTVSKMPGPEQTIHQQHADKRG